MQAYDWDEENIDRKTERKIRIEMRSKITDKIEML